MDERKVLTEELWAEIKRKSGRLIVGTILIIFGVYLNNKYGPEIPRNALFFIVLITIFLDFLRVDLRVPVPIFEHFLMRPIERVGLHGATLAGIGCVLAFTFFDFDIALAAAAMYLYGDAASGILGRRFGKTKIYNGKSLEGSLAFLAVAAIAGFVFLNNIFLIMGMAIMAALIEMVVIKISDDLILPLYTALGGQILALALGLRLPIKGFSAALIAWLTLLVALAIFFGASAFSRKLQK